MRCNKFVHAVMAFMTVILLVPHAFAGDCIPFQVSCEKVDSMYIDLASDLRSDFGKEEKKLVVACVVSLTPEAHQKMIRLMGLCGESLFPIQVGSMLLTHWNLAVRLNNGFYFTGETWPEVREKVLAICPEKIPKNIPQRVLDHKPQK